MKNLVTALMLAGLATVAALPQQQSPPAPATDATTVLQPIGNGFVGGVSVPAGTAAAGTAGTNLAPSLNANGPTNAGLGNGVVGNNALTNGGGTAFNAGTGGGGGGLGASVQQQLAQQQQQQAALSAGVVGGGTVPGQVDLANNAFTGGRVGIAAGPGVVLPLGRSQVLPNQKFIVTSRMMIQVADGALLCDAGGNVGLQNGIQQQGQQEFILRQGQMYRFRGAGLPGLNQGLGVEACIAERPSVVLAEPY